MISVETTCRTLSPKPAQLVGLYPRKGAVRVGVDADLAILHPTHRIRVEPATMEANADRSFHEGRERTGLAHTTLSRGEICRGRLPGGGREGRGRWLHRKTAGMPVPGAGVA